MVGRGKPGWGPARRITFEQPLLLEDDDVVRFDDAYLMAALAAEIAARQQGDADGLAAVKVQRNRRLSDNVLADAFGPDSGADATLTVIDHGWRVIENATTAIHQIYFGPADNSYISDPESPADNYRLEFEFRSIGPASRHIGFFVSDSSFGEGLWVVVPNDGSSATIYDWSGGGYIKPNARYTSPSPHSWIGTDIVSVLVGGWVRVVVDIVTTKPVAFVAGGQLHTPAWLSNYTGDGVSGIEIQHLRLSRSTAGIIAAQAVQIEALQTLITDLQTRLGILYDVSLQRPWFTARLQGAGLMTPRMSLISRSGTSAILAGAGGLDAKFITTRNLNPRTLTGEGYLTASLGFVVGMSATLAGASNLIAQLIYRQRIQTAFAGTGSLTALLGFRRTLQPSPFAGTGALTATLAKLFKPATMAGAGSWNVATLQKLLGAQLFAGVGTITTTTFRQWHAVGNTFAGAGSLTLNLIQRGHVFLDAIVFSGAGTMTGVPSQVSQRMAVQVSLAGAGTLTAPDLGMRPGIIGTMAGAGSLPAPSLIALMSVKPAAMAGAGALVAPNMTVASITKPLGPASFAGAAAFSSTTSLVIYPDYFADSSWGASSHVTLIQGVATLPNGRIAATRMVESNDQGSLNPHDVAIGLSLSGTGYAVVGHIRKSDADNDRGMWFIIGDASGGVYQNVDPNNSANNVAATTYGSGWSIVASAITDLGNSWWRCYMRFSRPANASLTLAYRMSPPSTWDQTYNGDGWSGITVGPMYLYSGTTELANPPGHHLIHDPGVVQVMPNKALATVGDNRVACNYRINIKAAMLSSPAGCTKIRLAFLGCTDGLNFANGDFTGTLGPVYIGRASADTNTNNFFTTPIQLTFKGGGDTSDIYAGETIYTDAVAYTLDNTHDLLVSFYLDGPDMAFLMKKTSITNFTTRSKGGTADESGSINASGTYVSSTSTLYGLLQIDALP